jgi:hypothetical protein
VQAESRTEPNLSHTAPWDLFELFTLFTPTVRRRIRSLLTFHDGINIGCENGMASTAGSGAGRRQLVPAASYLFFFFVFTGVILVLHWPYLRLPYFWDEMGQFVPAARDIIRDGAWIPHSAAPNVHPPGVMAYVALVWRVASFSISATRLAMLLIAAFGLLFVFLLGIELGRPRRAVSALLVPALLLFSPLFYTQAMLAQLDMPAMVLTALALLLFLRQHCVAAACVSTLLVLVRETGIVVAALFLFWLVIRERRLREASYFLAPFVALGVWLFILKRATGHWLGDPEFATFNLAYSLNPARAGSALVRRLYYLFVAEFRWVGTLWIVNACRKSQLFATPQWALVGLFAAAQVLLFSLFGGATLDRYLLPALPIFYIAAIAAWALLPSLWRTAGLSLLLIGLMAGLFWDFPPSPFVYSLEDDLAMVDFVHVQQEAANFLEDHWAQRRVASVWPLTQALSDPAFGYVRKPFPTMEISDFHVANMAAIDPGEIDALVVYARPWNLPWTVIHWAPLMAIQRNYYGYEPEIDAAQIRERFGFVRVARWQRHRQWIEVYARPG